MPTSQKTTRKKARRDAEEKEHHVVDLVLPEIKGTDPKGGPFAAKAKVLKDLVEHHAEEEEKEMFPRARKLMDRERLIELGEQLAKARETARTSFLERVAGMLRP